MSLRGGVLPPKQSPTLQEIASGRENMRNKNALATTFVISVNIRDSLELLYQLRFAN